jgi:anti-sigma regulatory factor (Ser/Thr protein kinase)
LFKNADAILVGQMDRLVNDFAEANPAFVAGYENARIIVDPKSKSGRRGWGLKLMKTLMDEVKLEQVDDGTRISMTKYLEENLS